MATRRVSPRPLTELEVGVVTTLLSSGTPEAGRFLAQLPYARVVATWGVGSPSVDLEIGPGAVPVSGSTDGILAGGAVRDADGAPVGEVLVWVGDGRLSGIEYAWYTDERPRALPDPDRIDLL